MLLFPQNDCWLSWCNFGFESMAECLDAVIGILTDTPMCVHPTDDTIINC